MPSNSDRKRRTAVNRKLLFLLALFAAGCAAQHPRQRVEPRPRYETLYQNPNPTPPRSLAKNIVVPDKETAIKIAKAIWTPVYGENVVQSSRMFDAVQNNGIWTVTAKFSSGKLQEGTAMMDISQEDGRVSRILHGQFEPGREWR